MAKHKSLDELRQQLSKLNDERDVVLRQRWSAATERKAIRLSHRINKVAEEIRAQGEDPWPKPGMTGKLEAPERADGGRYDDNLAKVRHIASLARQGEPQAIRTLKELAVNSSNPAVEKVAQAALSELAHEAAQAHQVSGVTHEGVTAALSPEARNALHTLSRLPVSTERLADVDARVGESIRRNEERLRNIVADEPPQWTDPEPFVWLGNRYPDADPAGQDFDFSPEHKPRFKNEYVGDLLAELLQHEHPKTGDRILELLIFVLQEHHRAGLTGPLSILLSLIVEDRASEHRQELADRLEALLSPERTLLAGSPAEPSHPAPFSRRVVVIDVETGQWLPGSATISGIEGARVAASVLPGMTAQEVDHIYGILMEGDNDGGVMLRSGLHDAAERVYAVNSANGWFEDDRTVGDDIALLHSEVSEMLEAFRDGGLKDQTDSEPKEGAAMAKPEGFGSEAADVFIRLLDTCKRRGVDLAYEFERKLAFNGTRGHRHGGKKL